MFDAKLLILDETWGRSESKTSASVNPAGAIVVRSQQDSMG
jgi:hypothetical protein